MRRQLPDRMPSHRKIPVLEYVPSGGTYLVLGVHGDLVKDEWVWLELIQYNFDPRDDMLVFYRPFREKYQTKMVTVNDPFGGTRLEPGLKDWKPIDWRFRKQNELDMIIRALPDVLPQRRVTEARKELEFFKDENVYRMIEHGIKMGPATTPGNPEIETAPKVQIIKTR